MKLFCFHIVSNEKFLVSNVSKKNKLCTHDYFHFVLPCGSGFLQHKTSHVRLRFHLLLTVDEEQYKFVYTCIVTVLNRY